MPLKNVTETGELPPQEVLDVLGFENVRTPSDLSFEIYRLSCMHTGIDLNDSLDSVLAYLRENKRRLFSSLTGSKTETWSEIGEHLENGHGRLVNNDANIFRQKIALAYGLSPQASWSEIDAAHNAK